ncbi:MAG: hypothetical protein R3Y35_08655 [Clostridia bacterium]
MVTIAFLNKLNRIFSNTKLFSFICLIIILILLLGTTTASIFDPIETGSTFEKVDVVSRTSLSSIFGYIISTTSSQKKEIVAKETDNSKSAHIIVVASVCIYCLSVTLICRSINENITLTASSFATITQYRDFICSGIGALIGLSRNSE